MARTLHNLVLERQACLVYLVAAEVADLLAAEADAAAGLASSPTVLSLRPGCEGPVVADIPGRSRPPEVGSAVVPAEAAGGERGRPTDVDPHCIPMQNIHCRRAVLGIGRVVDWFGEAGRNAAKGGYH